MPNNDIINLLYKIESFSEFQNNNFDQVLQSYNISKAEYEQLSHQKREHTENIDDIIAYFKKDTPNYFTISSRDDFNQLTVRTNESIWEKTLIYHPLNDHSRRYLTKGDILFCYRQGQFSSLDDALNIRGIYAVGIAATDPMILYPDEEGYKKYGIVVCFPILLDKHLELRNIQMHPNTIALTPYNGNRNDALQHIPDKNNYKPLIGMLLERNKDSITRFQQLLGQHNLPVILPIEKWKISENAIGNINENQESIQFDVEAFITDLKQTGLLFDKNLIYRFISALLSKRFTILTGLSGSGKTKLAQSFVKWITKEKNIEYALLRKALFSKKIQSNYEIITVNPKIIELINISGSTGKIIPIPTEVFYEWYHAFLDGVIILSDDPKEKRHQIGDNSNFQKYIHGFYNELFKISSIMFELSSEKIEDKHDQYKIISVGSDWTNREPLLGFPNALEDEDYIFPDSGILNLIIDAESHPNTPFFIILDEMNMSHVERYFADFLSSMESDEPIYIHNKKTLETKIPKEIFLPKNLFIIGTVNIDDTTYMFSPKVLDRANVIEFRVSDNEMEDFIDNPSTIKLDFLASRGFLMGQDFVKRSIEIEHDTQNLKEALLPFFKELQEVGAEFGYRVATEIKIFIKKCSDISGGEMSRDEIIDAAIMQKLLPKLHGSRNKIENTLKELGNLCLKNPETKNFPISTTDNIRYPVSYEKLHRMYKHVIADGFTSYAEA
ncbi:MAG: hypothetical protein JEY99_15200 [Spirochaetales bacterium]|nr:hypothetical protein [Spirochaetales bacterium]